MNVKRSSQLASLAVFALLLLPAAVFAEEPPPERGSVEFGVRYVWGDVYGRPDLQLAPGVSPGCVGCGTPFDPLVSASKYEEYRDLRNGFFIKRVNATFDNVLNSKNYVSVQSQKTLYHDQSYLATFGQYGVHRNLAGGVEFPGGDPLDDTGQHRCQSPLAPCRHRCKRCQRRSDQL